MSFFELCVSVPLWLKLTFSSKLGVLVVLAVKINSLSAYPRTSNTKMGRLLNFLCYILIYEESQTLLPTSHPCRQYIFDQWNRD